MRVLVDAHLPNRLSEFLSAHDIESKHTLDMSKKKFDCVKSVRKERDRIATDTEGMSAGEILEYFRYRRKKVKAFKEKP